GQVDHAVGDDRIGAGRGQRQCIDVAVGERDVLEPGGDPQPFRLGELAGGHVDARDAPGRADGDRGDEHVHARARPEIDHDLPLAQVGEVEGVTDAGERVDRAGGDAVE